MTALPAATAFTDGAITEAQFKSAITDLRAFLAGLLGSAGDVATAQAALDVLFGAGVDAKTGAYTVVAADRGKLLNCTGTWTLTLLAAATAGNGFAFSVANTGSGVITIDANASELIEGNLTITVPAGASIVLVCDGTAWLVASDVSAPTAADVGAVSLDHGHNVVGSLCYAASASSVSASTLFKDAGATVAGSSLVPAGQTSSAQARSGSALSGTWRCLGYAYNAATSAAYPATLWQRIA